ncbi:hypothetical protein D3C75_897080 [compost metagenome]
MPESRPHSNDQPPQEGQRQHGLGQEVVNPQADLGEGAGKGVGATRRRAGLPVELLDHGVDAAGLGPLGPGRLGNRLRRGLSHGQSPSRVEAPQFGQIQRPNGASGEFDLQSIALTADAGRGPVAGQTQNRRLSFSVLNLILRRSAH